MISDSETTASSQDNFMPYIVNIEGNESSFHDDLENDDESSSSTSSLFIMTPSNCIYNAIMTKMMMAMGKMTRTQ